MFTKSCISFAFSPFKSLQAVIQQYRNLITPTVLVTNIFSIVLLFVAECSLVGDKII